MEMRIKLLQYLAPDGLNIDSLIREVLEETKSSFENMSRGVEVKEKKGGDKATPGELFFFYWQLLMMVLLAAFALSCVSVIAQHRQLVLDNAVSKRLRNRLPHSVRLDITSPKSGRLILPPPTPAHHRNPAAAAKDR